MAVLSKASGPTPLDPHVFAEPVGSLNRMLHIIQVSFVKTDPGNPPHVLNHIIPNSNDHPQTNSVLVEMLS